MKWQLSKILKSSAKEIEVDEKVDFADAVKRNPDIRKLSLVEVAGLGRVDYKAQEIHFSVTIKGEMTLACALTLDDVAHPFEAKIHPVFTWAEIDEDNEEEFYEIVGDKVELSPAVWQEIFLQIPLRVVKDGAREELAAKGIEFMSEEELAAEQETQIDPRLAVLKNLKLDE